ncbi:MAG TPA: hypothetical protein HA282_05355 [Nanoarchaeota archaeon]|nr:hypothetical protein [Candidatus Pacearchaeota archaeon]HIH17584.1 hypothetical protein [Nanoarchaeota archaeon]HIH33889.1 hypothetical protein [Nanoarchaeota archaeon]HIH51093.1 hypothetical protein [Nanoarchaeota archaeon]HIH66609.1 hypothetical protein [Nanoarchaeota archaeon]
MPQISEDKIKRIKETILSYLYHNSPGAFYTYNIAQEIVRDEEFTKRLLQELTKEELVAKVGKNSRGINYLRRARWRLSNKAFKAYSGLQ